MAQNLNNVQYVHMPNAGNQPAPPGQTYQLPPNSFGVAINIRIPDHGKKISIHKTAIGIRHGNAGEDMYPRWRDVVKDQLVARNFANLATFPEADFYPIVEVMRRLRPACDTLATASAANNVIGMQQVDDAVVQIGKDCGRKLMNTLANRAAAQLRGAQVAPLGQPGVPPAQVIIPNLLLPTNRQAQWGPPLPVQVAVVQQPAQVAVVQQPAQVAVVQQPAQVAVVQQPAQVAVVQQPAQVAVAPPRLGQGGPAPQPQGQVAVGPPPIPPQPAQDVVVPPPPGQGGPAPPPPGDGGTAPPPPGDGGPAPPPPGEGGPAPPPPEEDEPAPQRRAQVVPAQVMPAHRGNRPTPTGELFSK